MEIFTELYKYSTPGGIIIPQTSDVVTSVQNAFREIFGADIDLSNQTMIGRFVEAISLLIVDCIGVNAQNANGLNPAISIGNALDNIGKLFGVERGDDSDTIFRNKIMNSQSTGIGFVQSIQRAISQVSGVTSVCVLDNGFDYPIVKNGVTIKPHSAFICVGGGDNTAIANAIRSSISLGCDFEDSTEYGTPIIVPSTDDGSQVIFYRPTDIAIGMNVVASAFGMVEQDAVDAIKADVSAFVREHNSNSSFTTVELSAYITKIHPEITCRNVKIVHSQQEIDSIFAYPYNRLTISEDAINVEIVNG